MAYRFNKLVLTYARLRNFATRSKFLSILDNNLNEALSRETIRPIDAQHLYREMSIVDKNIPTKNILTRNEYTNIFNNSIQTKFNSMIPLMRFININDDNIPFIPSDSISIIIEFADQSIVLCTLPFNSWHQVESNGKKSYLETVEIIILMMPKYFDMAIKTMTPFKVVREEVEIKIGDLDIISAVSSSVKRRRTSSIKAIKSYIGYPHRSNSNIMSEIKMFKKVDVYRLSRDFGLSLPKNSMNSEPEPVIPKGIEKIPKKNILKYLMGEDEVVLHRPYHAFITHKLLEEAAIHPDVKTIKQTIYRIDKGSEILSNLILAAKNGKDVTVIIEPRARFDEVNNIKAINKLLKYGVTVIPGIRDYKTHSKILQITMIKKGKLKTLTNVATGNFNENTAKLYEDFDVFTTHNGVANEVSMLFNKVSGIDFNMPSRNIITSPYTKKQNLAKFIDEAQERIDIKVNHIGDQEICEALRRAIARNVNVNLIVRTTNKTENDGYKYLKSHMVVGEFLEHSRIYRIDDDIYLGSSDLLVRNTQRRFECMVKISNQENKEMIKDILEIYTQNLNRPFEIQNLVSKYHQERNLAEKDTNILPTNSLKNGDIVGEKLIKAQSV